MINVHALGGRAMMQAAREAVAMEKQPPKLIAVTLLTSMGERDLAEVGIAGSPQQGVLRLARLAQGQRARRRGVLGAGSGVAQARMRHRPSAW